MESTNKNTQSHHDTRATNGHPFTGRDALAQSIYTQRQPAAHQPLRALRRREVINKTGLSRTTLHLLEVAGKFPKHRLLTPRCAVWIESEVDQWLLDRLASPAAPAHLPNVALRRSTPGRGKRL